MAGFLMQDHIVQAYDHDIAALKFTLAEMGGLAEEQLDKAITALVRRDISLADEVIRHDERLDALERDIEAKVVLLIARRQPVAVDLREVMVAIRVASDIERIGDLAKNTAKRALGISEPLPRRLSPGLTRMGNLAQAELKEVLDAYSRKDGDKALAVWRSDEDLDALYNAIFRELLTYMMEDPRNITLCTHLLFGAKNLERIGDHATNIAENTYFLINGRPIAEDRPKKDVTAMMNPKLLEK
jgi:phosphate transport system protein